MILIIWLFLSTAVRAEIAPLAAAGLEFGGDTLVNARYSDGSTSNIQAGRGISLQGGALLPLGEGFEAQGTLGLKWTSTKEARNGSVNWIRWPLELLGFYRFMPVRLGAGLVYQFGNRLKGTKEASNIDFKFDNALGFVLAGDYLFEPEGKMGAGLKYTVIEYKPQGGTDAVSGNSIGAHFHISFY